VPATYDRYGASDEAAIRSGGNPGFAIRFLLVSAMARVTENLGFGIHEPNGVFEHPYPFARAGYQAINLTMVASAGTSSPGICLRPHAK